MNQITVFKNRTTVVPVSLGFDVSTDTFTSEIRANKDHESPIIATWDVTFLNDGTDGELILTLDDSATVNIERTKGYMDIKRVTGGEPVAVFDDPIEVLFKSSITA